jgi:hypothetical protein
MGKKAIMGVAGVCLAGMALAGCQHCGNGSCRTDQPYGQPISTAQNSAAWNERPVVSSGQGMNDAQFTSRVPGQSTGTYSDATGPNNLTRSAPIPPANVDPVVRPGESDNTSRSWTSNPSGLKTDSASNMSGVSVGDPERSKSVPLSTPTIPRDDVPVIPPREPATTTTPTPGPETSTAGPRLESRDTRPTGNVTLQDGGDPPPPGFTLTKASGPAPGRTVSTPDSIPLPQSPAVSSSVTGTGTGGAGSGMGSVTGPDLRDNSTTLAIQPPYK